MAGESELIKHFQTLDIEEHIEYLLDIDKTKHVTSKELLAVYETHSLNKEVFNVLLSSFHQQFSHFVIGVVRLDIVISLVKRWERLGIDTAEKAMNQTVEDYEIVDIFERMISLNTRFMNSDFDFDQFRLGLSEQMVPVETLTTATKESIAKLAFIYKFTPIDMQKVVMMALDEDLNLSEDRLRKASAEFYKMREMQK